ncbi:MAG: TIGR03905 family TSCPD domain-containing protein [Phocaeicola sp.]|nr:TIGR03905 family TSCPD domain-containing protein [Phocaeicola sp.]
MKINYRTSGTCSSMIEIEVEDNKITDVKFTGGCNGNLKGISSLVKGMNVEDVISKLEGITCGNKITSCPDQLAKALKSCL